MFWSTVSMLVVSALAGLSFTHVSGTIQSAAAVQSIATINNATPTVSTLNTNIVSTPSEQQISATGFVSDLNGDADINSVELVLHSNTPGNGYTCTSNAASCIRTTCSFNIADGSSVEASYSCSGAVSNTYATGDWYVTVIVKDTAGASGISSKLITLTVPPPAEEGHPGAIGYLPVPAPVPTPPIGQQPPAHPVPPHGGSTTPPVTPPIGSDCIAAFYQQIDKPQSSLRGNVQHTEICNQPLVLARNYTGLLVYDFSTGSNPGVGSTLGIIVELPEGQFDDDTLTFYVDALPSENYPSLQSALPSQLAQAGLKIGDREGVQPIGFTVFNIYAKNTKGQTLTSLREDARVTLVIPVDLMQAKSLGLYRLDKQTGWHSVPFDTHDDYTLTFRAKDLGIFALFDAQPIDTSIFPEARAHWLFCWIGLGILLAILAGLIVLLKITLRKKRLQDERERMEREAAA